MMRYCVLVPLIFCTSACWAADQLEGLKADLNGIVSLADAFPGFGQSSSVASSPSDAIAIAIGARLHLRRHLYRDSKHKRLQAIQDVPLNFALKQDTHTTLWSRAHLRAIHQDMQDMLLPVRRDHHIVNGPWPGELDSESIAVVDLPMRAPGRIQIPLLTRAGPAQWGRVTSWHIIQDLPVTDSRSWQLDAPPDLFLYGDNHPPLNASDDKAQPWALRRSPDPAPAWSTASADRSYASCWLQSHRQQDLWLHVTGQGHWAAWINGRLICSGEQHDDSIETTTSFIRIPLLSGSNRLLLARQGAKSTVSVLCALAGFDASAVTGQAELRAPALPDLPDTVHEAWALDCPTIPADSSLESVTQLPVSISRDRFAPQHWLIAGPLDSRDGLSQEQGWRPESKDAVEGQPAFSALTAAPLQSQAGFGISKLYTQTAYTEQYAFAIADLMQPKGKGHVWLYTIVANHRPRLYQINGLSPQGGAWLSGKPIANGDIVRLPSGRFPLLVYLQVSRALPPQLRRKAVLAIQLQQIEQINHSHTRWLESARPLETQVLAHLTRHPQATITPELLSLLSKLATATRVGGQ